MTVISFVVVNLSAFWPNTKSCCISGQIQELRGILMEKTATRFPFPLPFAWTFHGFCTSFHHVPKHSPTYPPHQGPYPFLMYDWCVFFHWLEMGPIEFSSIRVVGPLKKILKRSIGISFMMFSPNWLAAWILASNMDVMLMIGPLIAPHVHLLHFCFFWT